VSIKTDDSIYLLVLEEIPAVCCALADGASWLDLERLLDALPTAAQQWAQQQ
jgi:hypothetical protein